MISNDNHQSRGRMTTNSGGRGRGGGEGGGGGGRGLQMESNITHMAGWIRSLLLRKGPPETETETAAVSQFSSIFLQRENDLINNNTIKEKL